MFHCSEDGCSHSYSRKDNLQRHMKTVHGLDDFSAARRFVCHIGTCRKAFFHATKLKDHYQEHGIQISKLGAVLYSLKHSSFKHLHSTGTEKKEFPSWEAFLSWKQSEEALSHTCFVQPKGEAKCNSKELGSCYTYNTNATKTRWYNQT